MNNELIIEIPEGMEIDQFDKDKGRITFKKKEPKYPMTIEDLLKIPRSHYLSSNGKLCLSEVQNVGRDTNSHMSTKSRTNAILALIQLVELKDAWNRIDCYVPRWNDYTSKYCIFKENNIIKITNNIHSEKLFAFSDPDTRDLFMHTFKDLFETAKEFI